MEDKKYLVLYRKWRPTTFDDVCGQDHITKVLRYETAQGHLSHAYLFCGSRGTGKTTCARILAKAANCLSPREGNPCGECEACRAIESGTTTDILEMDAASNNGVDNIRDIRDAVNFAPSDMKYRVYIIDEVHMLSPSAFNALLKTLEEPPEHVIFILATTELHKLPATIVSRCQRFDFRRISTDVLVDRLKYIAKGEGIEADGEALHLIARLSQGGMRDAISLLELCAGSKKHITAELVCEAVGSAGRTAIIKTAEAIAEADYDKIFGVVAEAVASSKDLQVFVQELLSLYRDMLVVRTTPDAARYLDLTDSETAELRRLAKMFSRETLLAHSRLLDAALPAMIRTGAVKRTVVELTLIRMSDRTLDSSNEALLARISELEDSVAKLQSALADGAQIVKKEDEKPKSSSDVTVKTTANQENTATEDKPAAEPKQAPVNAVKPREKAPVQTAPSLKPLRIWAELTERISQNKPQISAFLQGSRAYTDADGKVILRLASDFAVEMLDRFSEKDTVREALSTGLGRRLGEAEVVYEVLGNSDRQDDLMLELEDTEPIE